VNTDAPSLAAAATCVSRARAAVLAFLVATLAGSGAAFAADPPDTRSPWSLVTRVLATGSSDEAESDPAGYKAFSAFTLEAAVRRDLASRVGIELSVRTESRELDFFATPGAEATRLGSLELLPVNLTLQYRLAEGQWRPYVGAGLNVTVCWEKSGAVDSSDLSPSLAPALQLGMDIGTSSRASVNLDLRWNPLRTDLELDGARLARLKLDAATLGIGLAFRF